MFSSWEDKFAREIFRPLNDVNSEISRIRYGDWALKFAVLVSWRALTYSKYQLIDHFSENQLKEADLALDRWNNFLLSKVSHPGRFEQHLLPIDVVESHTKGDMSSFINRYNTSAIHFEPVCSKDTAMIFIKMFKVVICGHIKEDKKLWRNTKLHLKNGVIKSNTTFGVPVYLMEYMNTKANEVHAMQSELSDKQKNKISQTINKNQDKLLNSPIGKGIIYDVMHSREKAFIPKKQI